VSKRHHVSIIGHCAAGQSILARDVSGRFNLSAFHLGELGLFLGRVETDN
jgi:ABC-type uncharacterized transport system ATPase component